MALINNIALLKSHLPHVWEPLKNFEDRYAKSDEWEIVPSKSGESTLKYVQGNRSVFVHSKYDPIEEAKNFIESIEDIGKYKHVFFYGVGLGYHIEVFSKKYPKIAFTIYEPKPEVFYSYINHRSLQELNLNNLKNVYLEFQPGSEEVYINHFLNQLKDQVLFVSLPSYDRIFEEHSKAFSKRFVELLAQRKDHISTTFNYEQLWTINSAVNFNDVISTPNILRSKKEFFKGKPAIIVSAGPSLQEEFDNLRRIKENGLAYIFAVGSANKALLANDIKPDAVTSYDPNLYNHVTFEEIIRQNITDIPLVFGSSVGFETTRLYPGPKLHFLTSQDTISPYYLGEEEIRENNEIITDAPTIAALTLEILFKLGANPIVLVGQNFAFKNDQYYSSGVNYSYRTIELTEQEKSALEEVESVDGGTVQTFNAHTRGRAQMERYIALMSGVTKILNTTKGGAKINGAPFIPLEELLQDQLTEKVVDHEWAQSKENNYDLVQIEQRAKFIEKEYVDLRSDIDEIVKAMRKLNSLAENKEVKHLEKLYGQFDKKIRKLLKNKYFEVYLRPMVRVQEQFLRKSITEIRVMKNPIDKANATVEGFGKFIFACQKVMVQIEEIYNRLHEAIYQKQKEENHDNANQTN